MKPVNSLKFTPWDAKLFGMDTYEIECLTPQILDQVQKSPGHYTVKVHPLACKKLLHHYGFYYCDTLVEPVCERDHFIYFEHEAVSIAHDVALEDVLLICQNAFHYGRFHRDIHLDKNLAEARYRDWTQQLHASRCLYALHYQYHLAGYIAYTANKLVLHALSEDYRGKGLAKYFWSKVCQALFAEHPVLLSSISAANLAVVNLYASLGFRFKNAVDVYQKLVT